MNGKVVGVIANNPMVYGGAMDVKAARKQIHFVEMCDCFHIPLVFLVDVPGFMVGKDAEASSDAARRHARGLRRVAGERADVSPWSIRKCYGMAGMGTTDKNGLDFKIAWPSAEWGSLPIEGGVAAAFRREIAARRDPKAREREIEAELRACRLAVPHRRGVRRRGDHRSARDAAVSLQIHRCSPRQPQDQARPQAEVWSAPLRRRRSSSQMAFRERAPQT